MRNVEQPEDHLDQLQRLQRHVQLILQLVDVFLDLEQAEQAQQPDQTQGAKDLEGGRTRAVVLQAVGGVEEAVRLEHIHHYPDQLGRERRGQVNQKPALEIVLADHWLRDHELIPLAVGGVKVGDEVADEGERDPEFEDGPRAVRRVVHANPPRYHHARVDNQRKDQRIPLELERTRGEEQASVLMLLPIVLRDHHRALVCRGRRGCVVGAGSAIRLLAKRRLLLLCLDWPATQCQQRAAQGCGCAASGGDTRPKAIGDATECHTSSRLPSCDQVLERLHQVPSLARLELSQLHAQLCHLFPQAIFVVCMWPSHSKRGRILIQRCIRPRTGPGHRWSPPS